MILILLIQLLICGWSGKINEVEIRIKKDKKKYILQIANIGKDGKASSYVIYCNRYDKIIFSDNVCLLGKSN